MRFVAEVRIWISVEFTKRGITDTPTNQNAARQLGWQPVSQHWLGLRVTNHASIASRSGGRIIHLIIVQPPKLDRQIQLTGLHPGGSPG